MPFPQFQPPGSECQTFDGARIPVAGEIERLFEAGEVQLPMSGSGEAGEQPDGPVMAGSASSNPVGEMTVSTLLCHW